MLVLNGHSCGNGCDMGRDKKTGKGGESRIEGKVRVEREGQENRRGKDLWSKHNTLALSRKE